MLRWGRRRAGLTQRELAIRAGVSQPTVARIEGGLAAPRAETLDRLLRACGLMLDAIPLEGTGVDRTVLREQLAASPEQRAAFAQRGAQVRSELARAAERG